MVKDILQQIQHRELENFHNSARLFLKISKTLIPYIVSVTLLGGACVAQR